LTREFINTPVYDKLWNDLGLTDDDLCDLQNILLSNPQAGDIIEGAGGATKIRYALKSKGKSGGVRVIYADLAHKERLYLLLCYSKSKQDDLTTQQKKQLKALIKTLKGE
jgi:hypothetical protein